MRSMPLELKEKTARLAELDELLNLDDRGRTEVLDTEQDKETGDEIKDKETRAESVPVMD